MSSDLRALLAETNPAPITRVIGGVEYSFPRSIPARIGIALADGIDNTNYAAPYFPDGERVDFRRAIMGDALDQMVKDGCSIDEIGVVASYLSLWHTVGEKSADDFWAGLGKPRPPVGGETTSSGAAAGKTPRRASSSGTSTRTRKAKPKAA